MLSLSRGEADMQFVPQGHISLSDAVMALWERRHGAAAVHALITYPGSSTPEEEAAMLAVAAKEQQAVARQQNDDAKAELAAALSSGKLVALVKEPSTGDVHEVPRWYWEGANARPFGMTGCLELADAPIPEWRAFHHRTCSIERVAFGKWLKRAPAQHRQQASRVAVPDRTIKAWVKRQISEARGKGTRLKRDIFIADCARELRASRALARKAWREVPRDLHSKRGRKRSDPTT
jgi:hypothetical protein